MTIRSNTSVVFARRVSGSGTTPTITNLAINDDDFWMETFSHNLRRLGKGDVGGPWRMHQNKLSRAFINVPPYKSGTQWAGGNFTTLPSREISNTSASSRTLAFNSYETEARSKAPTAIAQTNPSVPEVDLGTALGEIITGGLPSIAGASLWKERANAARGAGSEYLNYQFGWVPLVNDIKNFAKTVRDANSIIEQYEKGSGQRQHRRFHFPSTGTSNVTVDTGLSQIYPTDTTTWQNGGNTTILDTTEANLWFSGCFKYYLPKSGIGRYTELADKLYGLNITPSTLWNLAPWSWAADWFGNAGDVFTNISYLGSDASVMEYGYMMKSVERVRTIVTRVNGRASLGNPMSGKSASCSTIQNITYKTRFPGSPYSFSASPAPLSTKQVAILAALGLSKT